MDLSNKRIAVAMSGGLDSSVAAALLVEQGADVVGVTAHMWKDGSRCCSVEDVQRAQRVSWHLGIEHFVLNASEMFGHEVVDCFVGEDLRGRAPAPCVICNQKIKFGFLLTRAVQMRCDLLATGHYAMVSSDARGYRLLKGNDSSKDQSYFLHRLSQRQLEHIIFPLGTWMKKDATEYAIAKGIPLSESGESQDVCFVPDGEYSDFVNAHAPVAIPGGEIMSTDQRVLGDHQGIHRYTVGQRRGLGISSPTPLYVTALDAETNTVTVGGRDEVMGSTCRVSEVNWIAGSPVEDGTLCDLRIRYNHEASPARLEVLDNGQVNAEFVTPQFAITPGQACVFYRDTEVLGGGWID